MRSDLSQLPLTCLDFFHRVFLIRRRFKCRVVWVGLMPPERERSTVTDGQ